MAISLSRVGSFLKYENTNTSKVVYFDLNDILVTRISGNNVFLNNGNTYDYTTLSAPTVSSAEQLSDKIGEWKAAVTGIDADNIQFIYTKDDFPAAVSNVITLEANKTYFIASDIDLQGDRLVSNSDTTIIGGSSENCTLTSTGLGVGVPLLTMEYTTPIRHISFENVDTAISVDGNSRTVALDWTGVNFVNVPNVGTLNTCDNFIFTKGAFINSQNFNVTGTIGTLAFNNSLFQGTGSAGNIINIQSGCTIQRRFRIIYSSIIAFSSNVGVNVDASATIPVEGYILDTVNFSGGGTYTSGVTYLDNKVRFLESKGVINTSEFGNYFMTNNATATTITLANTAYKIAGTTTANSINQKFSHTDNRLTYSGEITRSFQVTAIASFVSGNNKTVGLYVALNGSVLPESEMYATTGGNGRAESISVQTVMPLSENDYIEIWIENETDTTDITVEYLNVICKSI